MGLVAHKASTKGFRGSRYISSSLPKLFLAQAGSPGRLPALAPTDPDLPHLGIRLVRSRVRDARGVPDPAIRWGFVNTGPGFEVPAVWPSNGSATRRLLSSVGFPLVEFPDFVGTMKRSDFLASVSPRFVAFA